MANRLWCEKAAAFREPFLATLRNRFQSELGLVDFRQPEITRNTINDWVKEKTNQKIKELFKPGSINPQFRMAVDQRNLLQRQLGATLRQIRHSTETVLHKRQRNSSANDVSKRHFPLRQNNEMQILEKPYLGNYLSMVILLPKEPGDLPELEKSLTAEKLKKWSRLFDGTRSRSLSAPIQNGCKLRHDPQPQINGNEKRF